MVLVVGFGKRPYEIVNIKSEEKVLKIKMFKDPEAVYEI